MRITCIIISLCSFIFSTTHLVPEEYSSIQAGVDAAVDGDTVLVNQGIYYENIHLTKSIVLTSYAIYDDLENWTEYSPIFGEWQVANDNINNTIIDGSTATDDYGSCILIYSPSGDCISPEVTGFTIRNGLGTLVLNDPGTDQEAEQRLGGGILFDISDPTISFNQIKDNGSTEVFSGGGNYGTTLEEDWSFNNRDLNGRARCDIDAFNLENNLYDGNDALYGNTFANVDFEESINMSGSVFDVANCQIEEVSSVWVYVESEAEFELEDIAANTCAITGNSAYVNPNIEQECIDDGCGTSASNPFKTIDWALQMIMPSETNQVTLYLANGTYFTEYIGDDCVDTDNGATDSYGDGCAEYNDFPWWCAGYDDNDFMSMEMCCICGGGDSTGGSDNSGEAGEIFPIVLPSYVNIEGEDEESTILDAMDTGRVITMNNCNNNTISGITITGGLAEGSGGGMYLYSSNPTLTNVNITNNTAVSSGGGMILHNSDPILTHVRIENNVAGYGGGMYLNTSNPILTHVTISNNTVRDDAPLGSGGGMHLDTSNPTLTNMIISNNTGADIGGGMYLYTSNPTLSNVTIFSNTAVGWGGGGMYVDASNPTLTNVTISNNTAPDRGGGMYSRYCNPILTNSIIWDNSSGNGESIYTYDSTPQVTYSDIEGGWEVEADCSDGEVEDCSGDGDCCLESWIGDGYPDCEEQQYGCDLTCYDNDGGDCGRQFSSYDGSRILSLNGQRQTDIKQYLSRPSNQNRDGNIDSDPLFADPGNGDYTLQEGSPCIDTGNPSLWYEDIDGSVADMGVTGGLSILPNFISHDFGNVGNIGSSKQFTLYNFRETPITISSVSFGTLSFTTNTSFPITIEPLETGIINIDLNNSTIGAVNDSMQIISLELPQGLSVELLATVGSGNVLTGNLSGIYDVAQYRISGDITIADGDTVYLDAGTQFLFDGEYDFNIYGVLKAIGTESDSIIFDNYGDERWKGFTLDNVSDETELRYVRISGADKFYGSGMWLSSSNPILTHMTISNNGRQTFNSQLDETYGGGMYLDTSNPTLTYVNIINNTAGSLGGGIHLYTSNPILTHVTITNNMADWYGGGMSLSYSNPTLTDMTISNNMARNRGGGMDLYNSNPILTYVTIVDNTATDSYSYGGGIYLDGSNPTFTNVTISNNAATTNGGGMDLMWGSYPTLINSIVWDNNPMSIYIQSGAPLITYSDIQGGWEGEGEGNIGIDPMFVDSENGDYGLMEGSPCIDTGTLDLDGDGVDDITDFFGSTTDMGAFEFVGASIPGDLNGDSIVNVIDIIIVVNLIIDGQPYDSAADLNGDSIINIIDIIQILNIILDA